MAACLEVLGVKEHRWVGYPDGGCAKADSTAAAEYIAEIILRIEPDTILTFAADGQTGHPDHMAVHRWTVEAVRGPGSRHPACGCEHPGLARRSACRMDRVGRDRR